MKTLIISDIHGNLEALQTVMKSAQGKGFDRTWCLGDIIGYGPNPNECVEAVREVAELVVPGNHDWAVLGKLDINNFNADAKTAILWTRGQLAPGNRVWLASLNVREVVGQFTLLHGSPRHEIWEYITDTSVAAKQWDYFETAMCLYGHTHVPALFTLREGKKHGNTFSFSFPWGKPFPLPKSRLLINPGSVGQPRDSDPRASYAIWDDEAGTWTFHRVKYPIEITQRKMRQAGLPIRLALRLSYGW